MNNGLQFVTMSLLVKAVSDVGTPFYSILEISVLDNFQTAKNEAEQFFNDNIQTPDLDYRQYEKDIDSGFENWKFGTKIGINNDRFFGFAVLKPIQIPMYRNSDVVLIAVEAFNDKPIKTEIFYDEGNIHQSRLNFMKNINTICESGKTVTSTINKFGAEYVCDETFGCWKWIKTHIIGSTINNPILCVPGPEEKEKNQQIVSRKLGTKKKFTTINENKPIVEPVSHQTGAKKKEIADTPTRSKQKGAFDQKIAERVPAEEFSKTMDIFAVIQVFSPNGDDKVFSPTIDKNIENGPIFNVSVFLNERGALKHARVLFKQFQNHWDYSFCNVDTCSHDNCIFNWSKQDLDDHDVYWRFGNSDGHNDTKRIWGRVYIRKISIQFPDSTSFLSGAAIWILIETFCGLGSDTEDTDIVVAAFFDKSQALAMFNMVSRINKIHYELNEVEQDESITRIKFKDGNTYYIMEFEKDNWIHYGLENKDTPNMVDFKINYENARCMPSVIN